MKLLPPWSAPWQTSETEGEPSFIRRLALLCLVVLLCLLEYKLFFPDGKEEKQAVNERNAVQEKVKETMQAETEQPVKIAVRVCEMKKAETAPAKVEPTKELRRKKATKSPSTAVKSRAKKPKKVKVDKGLIREGEDLVGSRGERLGEFPVIRADYKRHLGFRQYVKRIREIGGRFFLMDNLTDRLVAEIDMETSIFSRPEYLQGLSPRSRVIQDEPDVDQILRHAEFRFGYGDYSVVLLLPLRLDAAIFAGIQREVEAMHMKCKDFHVLYGTYRLRRQKLYLDIYRAAAGIRMVPLSILFDLSGGVS